MATIFQIPPRCSSILRHHLWYLRNVERACRGQNISNFPGGRLGIDVEVDLPALQKLSDTVVSAQTMAGRNVLANVKWRLRLSIVGCLRRAYASADELVT